MAKPQIQVSEVEEFLRAALDCPIEDLSTIQGGEWSQAFSFVAGSEPLIARFAPIPDDFLIDRFASRFASAALPIPQVIEIGKAFGGHYAISRRHFGDFLEGGSEAHMRRKLPSLFLTLDAMREIDSSATSGYGLWRSDGSGRHASWREALLEVAPDGPGARLNGWRKRLARLPGAQQDFERAHSLLEGLVDVCPEARHLIHSDLIHRNVLVQADRISAVFDWGCAMYGDFLYDLAWLTFWAPWHPELRELDLRGLALAHYRERGIEVPDFEARLRCCELHIGLSAQAYCAFSDREQDLRDAAQRAIACGSAVG